MLTIASGKERTLEEFVFLGAATGWKLETAKPGLPSVSFMFPCEPVTFLELKASYYCM
jgi:hypothetical protein